MRRVGWSVLGAGRACTTDVRAIPHCTPQGAEESVKNYGYRYNVNHPQVRQRYSRFKQYINVPEHIPLSDIQRAEFERHMDKLFENGKLPPDALIQCPENFGRYMNNQIKENDL